MAIPRIDDGSSPPALCTLDELNRVRGVLAGGIMVAGLSVSPGALIELAMELMVLNVACMPEAQALLGLVQKSVAERFGLHIARLEAIREASRGDVVRH